MIGSKILTGDEARRIAVNFARLRELLPPMSHETRISLFAALAPRRGGRSDQRSRVDRRQARNRCPDTHPSPMKSLVEASGEARPAVPRLLRPTKNWRFACAGQACWRNTAEFAAVARHSGSAALRFAQSGPPHRLLCPDPTVEFCRSVTVLSLPAWLAPEP